MRSIRLEEGGSYFGRFEHGCELVDELGNFLEKHRINSAIFQVIGAVEAATIAFYDQCRKEYVEKKFDEPLEVVHCFGNVCLKEGKRFPHAHICLARGDGTALGGHLVEAKVFAGELYLKEFTTGVERTPDEVTGLSLMNI